MPHFPADARPERRSDGDLCVQACADDPQVVVHAVRNPARAALGRRRCACRSRATPTSSTATAQVTPRNLFGFKDGTANLQAEETDALEQHLWVGADDDPKAGWLSGGSYLVARRISMNIETWDRTSLREQEAIMGRDRRDGAPLSGGGEFTEPDFAAVGGDGASPTSSDPHPAVLAGTKGGYRIPRRGDNYTDGSEPAPVAAGLFFIAFDRDPRTQYVPMQHPVVQAGRDDGLANYLIGLREGLEAIWSSASWSPIWCGRAPGAAAADLGGRRGRRGVARLRRATFGPRG